MGSKVEEIKGRGDEEQEEPEACAREHQQIPFRGLRQKSSFFKFRWRLLLGSALPKIILLYNALQSKERNA